MIKACVIGWPVAHSRSPLIHGFWLRQLGIAGEYQRIAVAPAGLEKFLIGLPQSGFAGCNITIPHKEQAAALITSLDERARRIGSVNTVFIKHGILHATSTDGVGFCQNVEETCKGFDWRERRVLILGAGGSASAIIDEILRRGVAAVSICNRTEARAKTLALRFGANVSAHGLAAADRLLAANDVLVNTTSLGRGDGDGLALPLHRLPPHAIVADINYVPLKTRLLSDAERRGLRIVTGLGMLLHQAVPGFELWFGQRPQVTAELYEYIAADIDPAFKAS
jgi:shikimate dehydrogenase